MMRQFEEEASVGGVADRDEASTMPMEAQKMIRDSIKNARRVRLEEQTKAE